METGGDGAEEIHPNNYGKGKGKGYAERGAK